MSVLTPSKVSTRKFTWHAATQTFSAEASDLGLGYDWDYGQVYDDAADFGFTLVSHKTGAEVVFSYDGTHREGGELLYEKFVSLGRNGRPDGKFKAVVFND